MKATSKVRRFHWH